MATKIEAIGVFRPKLALNPTARLDQVVDFSLTHSLTHSARGRRAVRPETSAVFSPARRVRP